VDVLPRYSSMPDPLLEPLSGHHLYRKIRSLHECVASPRSGGCTDRLSTSGTQDLTLGKSVAC